MSRDLKQAILVESCTVARTLFQMLMLLCSIWALVPHAERVLGTFNISWP